MLFRAGCPPRKKSGLQLIGRQRFSGFFATAHLPNEAPYFPRYIREKLRTYHVVALSASEQKKWNHALRDDYRAEAEEFAFLKAIQRQNKEISQLSRKTDRAQTQIRSQIGENAGLLAGKQLLEEELIEQKEQASEQKV